MRHLSIDIETYSGEDITKSGLYKYVQSPDFRVLLLAYSIDFGATEIVDLTAGEVIPACVCYALFDARVLKHAYNAAFEWYCLSRFFALSDDRADKWLSQWRCTMLHGLYCGYPGGLAKIGQAIGLAEDKKKLLIGKSLIRLFCCPDKKTGRPVPPSREPEKWKLFKGYCKQDVVTETSVLHELAPHPVPDDIQRQWEQDILVNKRGVRVDTDLIDGALYCSGVETAQLTEEAAALTGLDNPNSVAQLKSWLSGMLDTDITSLDKAAVADLIDSLPAGTASEMLKIHQKLSKSSVSKYGAMRQTMCADGRIRGLLQFYGANRTGRWAGRLVQVQNLPRSYIDTLDFARGLVKNREIDIIKLMYGDVQDTLSQLIRTAFVPSEGRKFVVADFSAIEARVIAWLAGETWRLEVFKTHGKIYEASASQMFSVPIERIVKGNPEYALRAKGKVAELALGYQGSSGALKAMGALDMGLSEEDLPDIVGRWRQANPRIVDLWGSIGAAAMQTVRTGQSSGAAKGIIISLEGDSRHKYMTIRLPSGRKLYYCEPHMSVNQFGRPALAYWGVNTGNWRELSTYGGKLTENIVQAIARDCLAVTLDRIITAGYEPVMHIHDEVVVDCPAEDAHALDNLYKIMSNPMPWAPDLPLKGSGFEGNYYQKD